MLIQEYEAALADMDKCQRKLKVISDELNSVQRAIKDGYATQERLKTEKAQALEEARRQVIEDEIAAQKAPLEQELQKLRASLEQAADGRERQLHEISLENYNLKRAKSFGTVNYCLGIVTQFEPHFKPFLEPYITQGVLERVANITVTDTMLTTLAGQVATTSDISQMNEKIPLIEQFAVRVFLPKKRKNGKLLFSPLRIVGAGAKAVILIGLIAVFQEFVIVPYCVVTIQGVSQRSKNVQDILKLMYPYEYLKHMTLQRKRALLQECEGLREKDKLQVEKNFKATRDMLLAGMNRLQEKLDNIRQIVLESINEEEISQRVDQQYANKVAEITFKIKQNEQVQGNLKQALRSGEEELGELEKRKVILKQKIESTLINLDNVGTSRLILKSFFLGFDDCDHVIALNYDADTTLILYSGADSSVVAPFIKMLVIQYFTNVMVNSLHIDIVDLDNGGIQYDIFRRGCLGDNIIHITSSPDEESQLIDNLHSEMRTRSERISRIAEDIESYNKIMIQRDSIPMEYEIAIFQAFSESVISNQKFLQLCRQGAKNGIIPIVFMNINTMPLVEESDGKPKFSSDQVKRWHDLIYAVPKEFFNFSSETGEVVQYDLNYKENCVKQLEKLMAEV